MPDYTEMQRLLADENPIESPLSKSQHDAVLAGHVDAISQESVTELRVLGEALEAVRTQQEVAGGNRTGEAVLRTVREMRQPSSDRISALDRVALFGVDCARLTPPRFVIQSAERRVPNPTGKVLTFTRANASAGTLEVAAATGEFGGVRWPSSETFIFGFNQARASIGGFLSIPSHPPGAVLVVRLGICVEQILFGGGTTPGTASSLLHTLRGDGDLPLRGTALGWCDAGLSLYGAAGGARTVGTFVSEWINRDGAESDDRAPGGVVSLTAMAALAPETSSVGVFVDVRCLSAAEESEEPFRTGFAIFECRDKPVEEITGAYVFPSRLRICRLEAQLCQLPYLSLRLPQRRETVFPFGGRASRH
jgi:hypothetical protein